MTALHNVRESGNSVNNMVDRDLLEECIYRFCLLRLFHHIQIFQIQNPNTRIFINKTDLDATFRCMHVLLNHTVMCITIVGAIGCILGRCPFGTNEGPGKFYIASEIVIDLVQELADNQKWDPSEIKSLHWCNIPKMEENYTVKEKFGKAMPLILPIQPREIYIDGFINDIMTVILDGDPSRIEKAKGAVPLALHTIFQPTTEDKPVDKVNILSF